MMATWSPGTAVTRSVSWRPTRTATAWAGSLLGVDSRITWIRIQDNTFQGTQCCHDSVGADIDYVEALTSHPVCPPGAVCREE